MIDTGGSGKGLLLPRIQIERDVSGSGELGDSVLHRRIHGDQSLEGTGIRNALIIHEGTAEENECSTV